MSEQEQAAVETNVQTDALTEARRLLRMYAGGDQNWAAEWGMHALVSAQAHATVALVETLRAASDQAASDGGKS